MVKGFKKRNRTHGFGLPFCVLLSTKKAIRYMI